MADLTTKKKGIKNLKELLLLVKLLMNQVAEATTDREFTKEDAVGIVVAALMNGKLIIDAVEGIAEIKEEIKDLEREELIELLDDGADLLAAIKKIIDNLKKDK